MNSPYSTPAPTPTEARPACEDNPEPFDALIDHAGGPIVTIARREAWNMCRECPIRLRCWTDNAGEDWMKALNPPMRNCVHCGRGFAIPPTGPNKKFCNASCYTAHRKARAA